MQPQAGPDKKMPIISRLESPDRKNRLFIVLALFLISVIVISYIIPIVEFGRFFGTDDYTHLFHTREMGTSTGISNFFENMGRLVSNPSADQNLYNYPFGLWVYGSVLAKITGISVITAAFLLIILFFMVIIGSFYVYCGAFLEEEEQKIIAVLFLLSMPNIALNLLSFRPSVFCLPFLFMIMYVLFREPFEWKLFPVLLLSIFIIIMTHTGTFIFLISFSILFYLLYCLVWGKVSLPVFIAILSALVIYIFSLIWFPEMGNQYELKTTLFLSPGNFLASKFNIFLPSEISNIFYQNVMVNRELAYVIVLGAFIFVLGKIFRYVHRKIAERFSRSSVQVYPAITLPISNISHSVAATPLWVGPLHVVFSLLGFFQLESKGKCFFISLVLVAVLPDMLFEAESASGVLREISYLGLIVPIAAALGFWYLKSYISTKYPARQVFSSMLWIVMLLVVIMTPALATTYYLPRISGEDYIIDGMQWLGENANATEKVIGYGYRTVPIYTNMVDSSYGVQTGYETRTLKRLLSGTLFSSENKNAVELQRIYGVKYFLLSDKIAANIGNSSMARQIDNNTVLDKMYSSKDFGVYKIVPSTKTTVERIEVSENISIENTGTSILIESDSYSVILNGNYPNIERFGTPNDNYLGEGFFLDSVQISGLREVPDTNLFAPLNESVERNVSSDRFVLNNLSMIPEIQENQITYRTVLKDQLTGENESSFVVRYTFYPTTLKREFLISNDWVTSPTAPSMNAVFSTSLFAPLNDFIIKGDQTVTERHIYPSQDSVKINEYIHDFYLHDGSRGIYLLVEPTAPYPSSTTYKGSTLYNMSSVTFSQSDALKPGATLHITQYLSPGNEITAEKNIQILQRIHLLDFPDGMIPIIFAGYRTPDTETDSKELTELGYLTLLKKNIPYTEVVVPERVREIPVIFNNNTTEFEGVPGQPALIKVVTTVDLQSIRNRNIMIIGSSSATEMRYFKSHDLQVENISSVLKKARDSDVSLIGYMPTGLSYNLDTLKIVQEEKLGLLLSTPVSPPYYGITGLENRKPQLAEYQGTKSDVVLFPVSYPMSSALSSQTDPSEIFSAWKATIDESVKTDGMVFFIIRSADIGDSQFTNTFSSLIDYAKTEGLTFTTPDVVAEYIRQRENIFVTGNVSGDSASITVTNNNNQSVRDVTIRVDMPILKGGYNVTDARIIKKKTEGERDILYLSTDIPVRSSQEITVMPAEPKKMMNITLPRLPIEGEVTITIADEAGNPLSGAEAIIDTKYYLADRNGEITLDLKRGLHTIQIQMPGYESYNSILDVKGRVYLLQSVFNI
jgi:hypothetical protein